MIVPHRETDPVNNPGYRDCVEVWTPEAAQADADLAAVWGLTNARLITQAHLGRTLQPPKRPLDFPTYR